MRERVELEEWTVKEFSDLVLFGFLPPVIDRRNWAISIAWFYENIAIEIELDFIEFHAFCLLVRLENGKLPDGYYASGNKPCRYHLIKVISEQRWPVSKYKIAKYSHSRNRIYSTRGISTMKVELKSFKTALMACLERIKAETDQIFSI